MSSSRLVLIFLGIILVVIVILTSNRIAGFLKTRFGNLVPPLKFSAVETTPTPSPTPTITEAITPTEIPTTKGGVKIYPTMPIVKGTPTGQIPSTGPEEFAYVVIGGSAAVGFFLKKISSK